MVTHMTRLEELHKGYEERFSTRHTEWAFTYNEHPPDDRIVDVWIRENGIDRFGHRARYDHSDNVWMSIHYSYRDWNVVAWKDI